MTRLPEMTVAGDISKYSASYSSRFKNLKQEYKQADTIFISYPKCGRTWIRYVIGHYLHLKYNVENTHRLNSANHDKTESRRQSGCPLISFTHDNHSMRETIPQHDIELRIDQFLFKEIYDVKPLVLVLRDPVDASISYYHMCVNILKYFSGTMEQWFDHPMFGLDALVTWFDIALDYCESHDHSLILHYNKLKTNNESWKDMIEFVTGCPVDVSMLNISLATRDFNKIKKQEMKNKKITDANSNELFFRKAGSNYQQDLSMQLQDKVNSHKKLNQVRSRVFKMS